MSIQEAGLATLESEPVSFTEAREALQSNVSALADIRTTLTDPCRGIAPVLEDLATESSSGIKIEELFS